MKKKIFIGALAFIGFVTTIKLAIIYYNANYNPYALASFCSVSDFIDCDGIAKTTESQFLGVPLAYWGMFYYAFVLMMLFVDKLKNIKFLRFLEVFKNPTEYIASLGLISFLISISLLGVSLLEIKKLCILCAFTYILNLCIGCIAADFKNGGFVQAIKQSVIDFVEALKIKKYLIAFIAVMVAAGGFLTYTTVSLKFAPQVKREKEFKEFLHVKKNKYAVKGNLLGDEDAKVIVYAYSDYQCPICFSHNIMMHKLAKEMKGVKVIHKNLPLDTDCNVYLKSPMHEGACIDARYAIAAEKQGRFWEMNDILFEHKPTTEAEIIKLAEKRDFDISKLKTDANSLETYEVLKKDLDEAYKQNIIGTPTTAVNGVPQMGIKKYEDYVEWVKKFGAEKR